MNTKKVDMLVFSPFTNGTIKGTGNLKEGKVTMLSLPMQKVYEINEDQDGELGLNPLINHNFKSIVIDLRKLDKNINTVDDIRTMLFVISAENQLKSMKIAFLGNEILIKKHFEIHNEDVKFFKSLSEAALNL